MAAMPAARTVAARWRQRSAGGMASAVSTEDEGGDPVRRLGGEALGDHAADREAGDGEPVDPERVECRERRRRAMPSIV